jgi:hypothetical protein
LAGRRFLALKPFQTMAAGATITRLSGPDGVSALLTDEAAILVGDEELKISARGAVGATQ